MFFMFIKLNLTKNCFKHKKIGNKFIKEKKLYIFNKNLNIKLKKYI